MILDILKALVYTAVFSLAATPLDFRIAGAIGAIDVPKDSRRMHSSPIPRIGGVSLFTSFALFCLIFCKETASLLCCMLSGAVLIVILGIIDDCARMGAKSKLLVQGFASLAVILSARIFRIEFQALSAIFSFVWLITLTNAHNFIDGLDGLCAGVSITESLALGTVLLLGGNVGLSLASFVLGGACIGFFPYNAHNAKIFMGDTGSTFLGFCLGAISAYLIAYELSPKAVISVFLIFLLPLADITFAVTRRLAEGKSPFAADRSHIHHILADKIGHFRASRRLRLISALTCLLGVIVYFIL